MICPSLPPQKDYAAFSKEMSDAIRVDRCEHVWCEVINVRGSTKIRTLKALSEAGLTEELALCEAVFGKLNADGSVGPTNKKAWERSPGTR